MKILNVIAALISSFILSYATAEEGKNTLSHHLSQKENNSLCNNLKNMGLWCKGISDSTRFSLIPNIEKSNLLETSRYSDKKLELDPIKESFESLNQSKHVECQNLKSEIARASRPNLSKIDQSTNTNFSDNGLFEMGGDVYSVRSGELIGPAPVFKNRKGRAQLEFEYMNKCGR